jgi:hypothetical protein
LAKLKVEFWAKELKSGFIENILEELSWELSWKPDGTN